MNSPGGEFRDLPGDPLPPPYRKKKIPKALAEQVWITTFGRVFAHKCKVSWCRNKITVFDYECGHNVPESKGGKTTLDNLVPICGECNSTTIESRRSRGPVQLEELKSTSYWCSPRRQSPSPYSL